MESPALVFTKMPILFLPLSSRTDAAVVSVQNTAMPLESKFLHLLMSLKTKVVGYTAF